jgi:TrmH family RNA methyltransferase
MIITSSQNSHIKLVRSLLADKKNREESQLYVIEGVRLAEEVMLAGIQPYFVLYSRSLTDRGFEIIEFLESQGIEIEETDAELLERVSDTRNSQGILMVLHIPEQIPRTDNQDILILDRISDPGNSGTLLRTAVALGFSTIITTPGSVDVYSPKVLRAAMGAHFKCSLVIRDTAGIYEICKEINQPALRIILADAHSRKKCWEMNLSDPLALVIGSEAVGPADALKSIADDTVAIPMQSGSESFNAAVSGGILMYEIYRQRNTI